MSLVSPQQLAETLGISRNTVYRKAQAGEFPSYKIGPTCLRFDVDEVKAAIERRRAQETAS